MNKDNATAAVSLDTYHDTGMLGITSQHDIHEHGCLEWLSCDQGRGIGSVESSVCIKEDHGFCFSLGVRIGDNFQRGSSLHQRHLHEQTPQVHTQNGLAHHQRWTCHSQQTA
jgi:hypothetical protein